MDRVKLMKFITQFAIGGTERQFLYLSKGLDRSKFDVQIGCLKRFGAFLKDAEALNVPISEYKTNSLLSYRTLLGQLHLAKRIRREGIQIIHAYGFYPNVFTIPAARMAGNCISIASVRDTGMFLIQKKMKVLVQRTACRFADCIVANSDAVSNWLISEGFPADRIRIIPNGIAVSKDLEPSQDFPIRKEFGIDRDAPVVAVVCRLFQSKGLEYFLEAVPGVIERFPKARFMIVGDTFADPEYRQQLNALAERLNVTDRVIFIGQRKDVPAILKEANLSVLPSLSEGLSNSLLEAMAAGLPIVATDVGGNPSVVRDGATGILIPARDPAALCRAMIQVLESPDLAKRFGKAGRERVIAHFSLESMVRRTQDLYQELMQNRGKLFENHVQDLRAAESVTHVTQT